MGGDFPKISSAGTNVSYDSREQRAARITYGADDDPQIVARGFVETDGVGGIFQVDSARNLRSVTISGQDVVVELSEDQTASRYPVILTAHRTVLGVADLLLDYQLSDLRRFHISGRQISTGLQVDLSATVVRFAFTVLRA